MCGSLTPLIAATLQTYIEKALETEVPKEKLVYIQGLFAYLSTAELKVVLRDPENARFRNMVLAKIDEYSRSSYLAERRQEYHRLYALFKEMFTYLVEDDSIPRRRSERQKEMNVRKFNREISNKL